MRRIITTLLITLVALVGVGALAVAATGSGGDPVTRARLERTLPVDFANQYVQQAALLGHTGITASSLHARAMCDRGGPDHPDVGPGSDWVCLMGWTDPNVPMPPEGYGKFELTVHSNDCFTAGGPTKLVGFQTITDKAGTAVANPVFEFDGCFDPNGDNSPTGVSYPSVLSVTSTVLSIDSSRRTSVQVTCGSGAKGCAGTMTITDGSTTLGTVPYSMTEESTATLAVPQPVAAGTSSLTFAFTPRTGLGPPKPSSVDVQH